MLIESERSSQEDPLVTVGAVPKPLPRIMCGMELAAQAPKPPPQILDGILHCGCKMLLGGTSKSNKSWCLIDLAASVASGQPWWGRRTTPAKVLYLNFELAPWSMWQRLWAIGSDRPECNGFLNNLYLWNLRGFQADLKLLRPKMEEQLSAGQFGLIVLDPAYKVLGGRDENSNGDVADLMNEFENLAHASGAALVIAHHFAKGDSTAKLAIDRMSGAGAWARDPDSILVLTPHEEEDCFTVTTILRNLPRLDDFVVRWDFPLMKVDSSLNPEALRRPQSKNKCCSDAEFVAEVISNTPTSRARIVEKAAILGLSRATTDRYLQRLACAGILASGGGLYWKNTAGNP